MVTINSILPFSILVTGFLGSLHCMGMCGPLVLASTRSVFDRWIYNVGRLLGYLILGAIMGTIGKFLFQSVYVWLQLIGAFFVGGVLVLFGFQGFFKSHSLSKASVFLSKHLMCIFTFIHQKFEKFFYAKSLLFGFFSAFLPCGLLYSIVLASVLTESTLKGALLLFFFWLGTVPAMVFAPTFLSMLLKRFAWISPRVLSGVFIVLGLIVFYTKLTYFGIPLPHSCCSE